jgi:hypothetical protein
MGLTLKNSAAVAIHQPVAKTTPAPDHARTKPPSLYRCWPGWEFNRVLNRQDMPVSNLTRISIVMNVEITYLDEHHKAVLTLSKPRQEGETT